MIEPKKEFMEEAIKEALKARERGDYAVGAVITKDDKIIARGGEKIKTGKDPTLHAEIVAIREASKTLGNRHLHGCVLYTTHEPCPMCAAAAVWAKMKGIIYGAKMEDMNEYVTKNGNEEFTWRTINISASEVLEKGNSKVFLVEEFMRDECKKLFHS